MQCGNAQFLTAGRDILGGKHGRVGGGFVAVCLYFHAAGDADESFPSGEIGDMDKGVVEGGEEMGHGENFFALDEVGCGSGAVVVIGREKTRSGG